MKRFMTIAIIGVINLLTMCGEQLAAAQNTDVCKNVTEIPKAECEALVTLYNSTKGDMWKHKGDWLTKDNPCEWKGVECFDGHVTILNLSGKQLSGSIPPELSNLSNLAILELSSNRLSGSIPLELSKLTHLKMLILSGNQLSGRIPSELDKLVNLEVLHLSGNRLSGSIPLELWNLGKLKHLFLNSNQLSGNIPPELSKLTNLTELNLSYNQLDGSIPPELNNLVNLKGLDLSKNQLSGNIPSELSKLANLTGLNLSYNQLNGSIPSELSNLAELERLDLSNNPLSGLLPLSLTHLAKLQFFSFYNTNLCEPTNPSFQKWLVEIHSMRNGISWVCNNETGIPQTECKALVTLYYTTDGDNWRTKNGWSQTNTPCSWDHVRCKNGHVVEISLSDNQLTGQFLPALGDLTELTHLDLSHNQLTGQLSRVLGSLTKLTHLDLSHNQLTGNISSKLGNLTELTHLDLSHNQLTGGIPSELEYLTKLVRLDLSNNQLKGHLPPALSRLTELTYLDLSDNQLSDTLPIALTTLTKLQFFAFDRTNLCEPADMFFKEWLSGIREVSNSGVSCICGYEVEIPETECNALLSLYYWTGGDRWKVKEGWFNPNTPCSWDHVTCQNGHVNQLSLNDNQLTGSLPPELGDLTELTYLDMSNNQLRGSLPVVLAKLTKLTSFFFHDTDLCEPADEAFQTWLNNLEHSEGTDIICPLGLFLEWLPVFIVILGGTILLPGIMMGAHESLKHIYGMGYEHVFGSMKDEKNVVRITGIFNRIILIGGLFGLLWGVFCLVFGNYAKAGDSLIMPGIVVGVIAGSVCSWKKRTWKIRNSTIVISILTGMTIGVLVAELPEEITIGIVGRIAGAVIGGIAGFFGGFVVLFMIRIVTGFVSFVTLSVLIASRFKTIICSHCLRYTYPFKSRYETGTRYCEHCQKPVERTDVVGKVIFTFGTFTLKLGNDEIQLANPNFELITRPGRVFICSNPGFKAAERGVDVLEVYIDTKTCESHRLERFMTYIVHTPLTYGLQSVKIFYQGELDDLGENLKNALRNTFKWIEAVH